VLVAFDYLWEKFRFVEKDFCRYILDESGENDLRASLSAPLFPLPHKESPQFSKNPLNRLKKFEIPYQ